MHCRRYLLRQFSENGEFLPARWCSRLPTSLAPPPESDMAYLSLLFLPFQMFPFRVGSGLHLLDMLIFHGRSRSPSCRCVADVVPAECSGGLPLRFLDRIDLEYLLLLIVYIQIVSLLILSYLSLFYWFHCYIIHPPPCLSSWVFLADCCVLVFAIIPVSTSRSKTLPKNWRRSTS